jgi:sulfocyanin
MPALLAVAAGLVAASSLLSSTPSTAAARSLVGRTGVAALQRSRAAAVQQTTPTQRWLKINTKTKTVVMTVMAGQTGANNGLNFDGYANGKATFVVPLNWHVQITFSNHADVPHSLAVATGHGDNPTLATLGGKKVEVPNATQGVSKSKTLHLSFAAKPAGKYFLVCLVPGHDTGGMWDRFTIDKNAKQPLVKVSP